MKKLFLAVLLAWLPAAGYAAGGKACGLIDCDEADVDTDNLAAVQRGAKYYVNYCMGCHSLKYMSYGRLTDDLGLEKEQTQDNLYFVSADGKKQMGRYMNTAMSDRNAQDWFGVMPPDLTLAARNRGEDWLYTYLNSFYVDEAKPLGVNNLVFPDVGMPHVLWHLEGTKQAVFEETTDAHGDVHYAFAGFEQTAPGAMNATEYRRMTRDLVTFLSYAAEPGKEAHRSLGLWVLLFLVIFAAIAYLLKKEFWKDVH